MHALLFLIGAGLAACAEIRAGDVFDGSGTQTPELAVPRLEASPSFGRAPRSSADLFAFSAQEAAQAAQSAAAAPPEPGRSFFDADVPSEVQSQMRGDLGFVQGIQGSGASRMHQQVFGGVSGSAYAAFFDSRVTAVGMDGCGSANAVACVIPWRNHNKMWLTQNFVRFSHPQIARTMIMFHEARHTERQNSFWHHASCPTPFRDADDNDIKSIWTGAPLAGEPACDTTPLGSYGSSTIMLKNIQRFCENCTDKVKMDAGLYGDDQFVRIVDSGARRQMREDLYP